MQNILIHTMQGLGDQAYHRPFIKILSKSYNVYLQTVLPRLYEDIPNIKFVKPPAQTFRTQQKQKDAEEGLFEYVVPPDDCIKIDPHYNGDDLIKSSIVTAMCDRFKIPYHEKLEWNLPDYSKDFTKSSASLLIPLDRKIAIVRPATIRKEWANYTRNANPHYIAWCAKVLHEAGYFVISIADLEDGKEWLLDGVDIPDADLKLHKGELGIYATFHLISIANIVVGGSGFIVPITVSTNTPLFLISGGRLAYDGISKILHPSMNLSNVGWAIPQNRCNCTAPKHNCDKTIPTLDTDFYNFLGKIQNENH